jgi:hypothetical protein
MHRSKIFVCGGGGGGINELKYRYEKLNFFEKQA